MQTLAAYATAHAPVLTIARENIAFTKPVNSATFLEAFLIPANTINPNVSADRRRFYGDFQINVWSKEGNGAQDAETIAEEISQLFKVFPKDLMPVSVEAPASIKKSLTDGTGYRVTPILIPYRMESEN
jgi:hypothetical protein